MRTQQVPTGSLSKDGHVRERVPTIQRARILNAMVVEISERGSANVTVAHVVARSCVSRRTFYDIFTDREDCFLAAFDDSLERARERVTSGCYSQTAWSERARAGLEGLLSLFEEDPPLGSLLVVEALGAGPRALERRRRVVDELAHAIDEGGRGMTGARTVPPLAAEGVVGAVLSVLHARLSQRRSQGLTDLANPLMAMVVLPYLGRAIAERELSRPTTARCAKPVVRDLDPLRDLQIRLTHRTVTVLLAVAANPGSSNRTIAQASGIGDQGQISKLLARLRGIGLIDRAGSRSAPGAPNAWSLTAKGMEVRNALGT